MTSSFKRDFLKAVEFSQNEIADLWASCPSAPLQHTTDEPRQIIDRLFLTKPALAKALELPPHKLERLLQGLGEEDKQLRFNALLEAMQASFQRRSAEFHQRRALGQYVPVPIRTAKTAKKEPATTSKALAVPSENPWGLVDSSDLPNLLKRKVGPAVFDNIAALARASGLCPETVRRIREGMLIRRSTREKMLKMVKLSTRTIVRRMRRPEEEEAD